MVVYLVLCPCYLRCSDYVVKYPKKRYISEYMKTPGAVAVWPLRPALFSFGAKRLCIPPPFPIHGKGGGSGGYTPAALPEITQPGQAVKGKPPQTAGVPPLDCPFPAALQNIRRRGIYHHRAHPRRGAFTSGQSVQKRGPVTSPSPFSCPAAPVRAAVSLSTRPAAP